MASKRPAENEEDVPILKKSTLNFNSSTFKFKPSTLDPNKNKDQKNPFLKPSSFANPFAKSTTQQPANVSSDNPFLNVSVDEKQDEDKSDSEAEDTKKRKADESSTSELSDSKVAKTEEKREDKVETKAATKTFGDSTASKFVFGQKLSERAKVDEVKEDCKKPLISFSTVQTKEEEGGASKEGKSEEDLKKLEQDAAEQFAAINNKEIAPEIDIKTGEEDEKCVLQVMCKLYQYDNKSQSWKERGVGQLHLNDSINAEQSYSRLVMRSKGSMRLVLNTKIWADMSHTRANKKSIRISARTQDDEIGVFLLQGSISDMTQMWQAIDYRVVRAKFARDKQREKEEGENPQTSNGDSQEEKEEAPKEKAEKEGEESKDSK